MRDILAECGETLGALRQRLKFVQQQQLKFVQQQQSHARRLWNPPLWPDAKASINEEARFRNAKRVNGERLE